MYHVQMKKLITLLLACCFGSAMAQSSLPACQGESRTWTNCYGTYTFADGDKYVGEYKDGKRNGQGTYTAANGNKYAGEFKDDKRNGQGTYTFASGNKYVGEFKDGYASGQGTYFYLADDQWKGDKYVGEHKRGQSNGQGTYTAANGNEYVGEYKDDKRNGQFIVTYPNGSKYVGEFKDDKRNGQGTFTWADGNKYVGEFKDGYASGQGTYTFASGNKYVGEFKDDNFNGQGIRFLANGKVDKSGIWKDGNLVQSKFIDVATFTRIPNLSNSASNLAQLRKTEEQAKQKQAELEAQRKATELALAQATKAAQEQVKLEAQLAAQQQIQIKPAAQIAPQGKRVALVIGNAKYKFSPLNNPVNDATDMAASLRSVGFDVIEVKDATLKQMRAATRQFADKLEVSDVGLVYYSGHGIEVKGKNYLIPVNADIRREYEVVDQAFDASNLLRMMESLQSGTKKRVNILIVDACRNNDLPKSWRSTNNGLARMDAPAGSFISFATAPGQVASDGQGRNSPYTKHLLNALKQPNVPIERVFKQVRRNVMDETGGEQVPWENSSLIGDFYFTVAR